MKKERHYFCVRLPTLDALVLESYQNIGGKIRQTQAQSGKKAVNNVIYHYGGENYALISSYLNKKYEDLSKFTIDLDEASKINCQYEFWKQNDPIESLDEKGLAKKIKTKLGAKEEDCIIAAREYYTYKRKNYSYP